MIPEPQTQFTYYSLGIHSGNKGWMCGKLLLQELSPFKKTFTAFGHFFRRLHFVAKVSNKNIKCLQTSCCTIKSRQLICCCCVAHIWDVLFCAQWQMGIYVRLLSVQCQRLPSIKCFLKTWCFNEYGILGNPDLDFDFHQLQSTACSSQFIL